MNPFWSPESTAAPAAMSRQDLHYPNNTAGPQMTSADLANTSCTLQVSQLTANTNAFEIPAFQRGYKWRSIEVRQLLDDVEEARRQYQASYCLQPVVVMPSGGSWMVIDGQQRLTTLYLLLVFLDRPIFALTYATRGDSSGDKASGTKDFLTRVQTSSKSLIDHTPEEDMDTYHFVDAWNTIVKWFNGRDNGAFSKYLEENVSVIWHPISVPASGQDANDAEKPFINFNSGRIELTHSERVKALFLNGCGTNSVSTYPSTPQPLRSALEIATEWDAMEQRLQEPPFWAFLNPKPAYSAEPMRMVLLFDLLHPSPANTPVEPGTQAWHHYVKMKQEPAWQPDQEWLKVRECFLMLEEWYLDRECFHCIGYLRTCENSQCSLREFWELGRSQGKKQVRASLAGRVAESLGEIAPETLDFENKRHHTTIHRLLLWFNIHTLPLATRFPFESYIREKTWSLEHIHAQRSPDLLGADKWKAWVDAACGLLDRIRPPGELDRQLLNVLRKDLVDSPTPTDLAIQDTFEKRLEHFAAPGIDATTGENPHPEHAISNLALLAGWQNSSLGNRLFLTKREAVMDWVKKGTFVLPATRDVFLKFHGGDIDQPLVWSKPDRSAYLDALTKSYEAARNSAKGGPQS